MRTEGAVGMCYVQRVHAAHTASTVRTRATVRARRNVTRSLDNVHVHLDSLAVAVKPVRSPVDVYCVIQDS